jgi:NAD(P)-dependent dehydrogenase (short-subunit alcohol dehydrogenase family)
MLNNRSEQECVTSKVRRGERGGPLSLDRRVVIVTGGARGLGRCEAEALAARGAHVVVADIVYPVDTVAAIRDRGGVALPLCLDLTEPGAADELFAQALAAWGDVHYLVNNAGVVDDAMSFNLTPEQWERVLAVNLTATFLLSQLAAAYWRERFQLGDRQARAIVNTSSESGLFGNAGQANYAAAKAGVVALTLTLAAELDRYQARANVIAPRARTLMSAEAFGELPRADSFDPFAPEPIADVVTWLLSDAAEDVTGQVLVVHGGGVELLSGWTVAGRVEQAGRWSETALLALREQLFDGSARHLPRPVSELFVAPQ